MSGSGRLELEPILSSVAVARALVGDVAATTGVGAALVGDAALIVSELVTNAVLHARTTVELAVDIDDDRVRIEVTDASEMPVFVPDHADPALGGPEAADPFDEPVIADLDAVIEALGTTGRGMELVASLAEQWGVTAHARGGKTVWAELRMAPARATGLAAPSPPPTGLPPAAVRLADLAEPTVEDGPVVRLVAVPLRLLIESDRGFDDTIRELQVIALSGDADPDMVALANRATRLFTVLGAIRF